MSLSIKRVPLISDDNIEDEDNEDDNDEVVIESGEKKNRLSVYNDTWKEYSKKYDAPVALLMQCGVFFNIIGYEEPDGTPWNNLRELANFLDLKVSPFSSSMDISHTNPLRCGVKWSSSEGKQRRLLDEGASVFDNLSTNVFLLTLKGQSFFLQKKLSLRQSDY